MPKPPRRKRSFVFLLALAAAAVIGVGYAGYAFFIKLTPSNSLASDISVTTYHYDNARTGADTNEHILTPGSVTPQDFGKLFSVPVDGQVYAQPLYLNGVLYVATMHDSVYAINATSGVILWQRSFIDPQSGIWPILSADIGNTEIGPEIGILGTPVIDPNTNTIYFVTNTRKNGVPKPTFSVQLHALDLATGNEKFNGPTPIATPSGTTPAFEDIIQNQRPALLLFNGTVYIAWSSYGDAGPYHGFVMAYDASDISKQTAVFDDTPSGVQGGIWMSGGGMSTDGTNVYVTTGNGTFSPADGNYSDSLIKLSPSLSVTDSFTPNNQDALNKNDEDLDATEPIFVSPSDETGGVPFIIVSDKTGKIFILNRDSLGNYSPDTNKDIQDLFAGAMVMNNMAYWDGHLYVGPNNASLLSYSLQDGYFTSSPVSSSSIAFGDGHMNGEGTNPIVSANGTRNGIVWTLDVHGYRTGAPPVMYAFDANNLAHLLWSSAMNPSRDAARGAAVKFTAPVVIDGRVYVPTDGAINVYGLLQQP